MSIPLEKVQALATQSPEAAGELREILLGMNFRGVVPPEKAAAWARALAMTVEQFALMLVPLAERYAISPVSRFNVGAVAVGASGALYFGANLEIVGQALSFTVHAEQAAVANAWMNGEIGLSALAVSSAPCGYCRQFLHELTTASTLSILLPRRPALPVAELLPGAFGPKDLGLEGGLMRPENHGLAVPQSLGATGAAALAAANASYSPYSSTFSGVALRTSDDVICSGRYAENAAHNPSMSPLGAALSQLVLLGKPLASIVEAVLVEAEGPASQKAATRATLACISPVPLAVHRAIAT
jgi:cytidine deaminase